MHHNHIQIPKATMKETVHETSSPPICGALILTAFALPLSLCPTPCNIRALLNSAFKTRGEQILIIIIITW